MRSQREEQQLQSLCHTVGLCITISALAGAILLGILGWGAQVQENARWRHLEFTIMDVQG